MRFGEKAAPLLAELLDNIDFDDWSGGNVSAQCGSHLRIKAAQMLARLGPEAKSAVPALVRALKDKDPFVRDAAANPRWDASAARQERLPPNLSHCSKRKTASPPVVERGPVREPMASPRLRAVLNMDRPMILHAGRAALLSRLTGFGYSYRTYNPFASIRPNILTIPSSC